MSGKRKLGPLDSFLSKAPKNTGGESSSAEEEKQEEERVVEDEQHPQPDNQFDIANFLGRRLSDIERFQALKKCWMPPKGFKFKKTKSRLTDKYERQFKMEWLEEFPWLRYSQKENGAFCLYCMLFHTEAGVGHSGAQKAGKLVKEKFDDWHVKTLF